MNQIEIDNEYKNRHNVIDRYIRLIAFCYVFTCHIQQYLGNGLCCGLILVQIFQVILGFLYGGKNVTDDVEFYGRKFKQITIHII